MFNSLPTQAETVISVFNCRAIVARWHIAGGSFFLESARNASELVEDAAEAVRAQGGALNLSGLYDCPPELAARATWGERPICEVLDCDETASHVPELRDWPDHRGAQLCPRHRQEALQAQADGALAEWIRQHVVE